MSSEKEFFNEYQLLSSKTDIMVFSNLLIIRKIDLLLVNILKDY